MYEKKYLECSRSLGLVVLLLLLVSSNPFLLPGAEQFSAFGSLKQVETELLGLINTERTKRGLSPLDDHPGLGEVSLKHSQKMAMENELSHDFPGYQSLGERLEQEGLFFVRAGENVAFSQDYVPRAIHRGFMDSPGHRGNILDKNFTHCSVRAVFRDRALFITQEFAELFSPLNKGELLSDLGAFMADWHKSRIGGQLISFPGVPDVKEFADFCAREYLWGRPVKKHNDRWGSIYLINLVSPRVKALKKGLKKQLKKLDFQAAEIGVVFGKHYEFTGGAYSLCAVLFPSTKYRKKTEETLGEYALKALNSLRSANGRRRFMFSKNLSREAAKMSRFYYESPRAPLEPPRSRQVLVYRTDDPKEIPEKYEKFLLKRKRKGRVGVDVFSPLRHGMPGSYFIVSFVITGM